MSKEKISLFDRTYRNITEKRNRILSGKINSFNWLLKQ